MLLCAALTTLPGCGAGGGGGDGTTLEVAQGVVDYPIVYVRAPRRGDDTFTKWPEVKDPIQAEPGTDLVLLHPDGREEVLVAGGPGAVVDPYPSFDARWVYYAKLHDVTAAGLNVQRRDAPRAGADIFKIHIATRQVVQLTWQEWTPNTGAGDWAADPLSNGGDPSKHTLGYGIFNLGPCPLPGGRVMFTSSRNGFLPNKGFTFPNLQLFVMDDDGKNVEQIGHLNLGSALHPTILTDGRVMFSSYEAQGLRDSRLWGLWAIWPDGRNWAPLMSAFDDAAAFHFQTQLSSGEIAVVHYYNQNNSGFGTVLGFSASSPTSAPPFGSPTPTDPSNPTLQAGTWLDGTPRDKRYSFSPAGLRALTPFAHGRDEAAAIDSTTGAFLGKVTHPAGAPDNDLLLVWSRGPANHLTRPVNRPVYDGGLYLAKGGEAAHPKELIRLLDKPDFNEQQPRPLVPYWRIYGIPEPVRLPDNRNDASADARLPAGTPFGLIGTSSFYKRNTAPGTGTDRFNWPTNPVTSNWATQGADAGAYADADIYAVRILAMEPTSHRSYGPFHYGPTFQNHASERLRILGEIPLRKPGAPLDPDGNPDTSFLALIPADTPFTFQTIDQDGMVLNGSQTWHQVRPGEKRVDCGGCHAHAQMGTDFALTAAAQPGYQPWDLTRSTPFLSKDAAGQPVVRTAPGAIDVEYYRDIKPILERSCVPCHSVQGRMEAALALDDATVVDGFENTWHRLANDQGALFGLKPMNATGRWRGANASRYVRMFQSRRSLLAWKVFGRRLDGRANSDFPTESVPGDTTTWPSGADRADADLDFVGTIMPPPGAGVPLLSEDDKLTIVRWIDLGCPIDSAEPGRKDYGWFLDDLRPTLTVSSPLAGRGGPLSEIRLGAFDYYSGLDAASFRVTASFPVNGAAAGTNLSGMMVSGGDHIWTIPLSSPITRLDQGTLSVSVMDRQGNRTALDRTFHVP